MLIPFTDIKGRTYYVNPVYVRVVQTNKKGQTEMCLTYSGSTWASSNVTITVDQPADQVVSELNAAMPLALDLPPSIQDDEAQAAAQAAATASMG